MYRYITFVILYYRNMGSGELLHRQTRNPSVGGCAGVKDYYMAEYEINVLDIYINFSVTLYYRNMGCCELLHRPTRSPPVGGRAGV